MDKSPYFRDRTDAATRLANLLMDRGLLGDQTIVIGLLRGGMPIAAGIATAANAQLGALAVRKLGFPSEPELAFGAIATYCGATWRYLNEELHASALYNDGQRALANTINNAQVQLAALAARFATYMPQVAGRNVIVCDDGLATGATMHAAIQVLGNLRPRRLTIAAPVAPASLIGEFAAQGTEVICLHAPEDFTAVGAHYADFSQVDEARILAALGGE